MSAFDQDDLVRAFTEHHAHLDALVRKHLKPILLSRFSYEDVLSEVYAACTRRMHYFEANEDIPVYFKLRTVLFQTLVDLERAHLQAGSRDAYKEVGSSELRVESSDGNVQEMEFAADITSPASRVDRDERHCLLRAAIGALPENDRRILVLRHFDGFGNNECAAILGIEPKAASIRYVRALEKLEKKLMEVSCFRTT